MIILILLLGAICLPLLWMCLTSVEPNLILPERMERGEVYEIGETIVVMNHEDYYDMLCKSMEAETKHGEWIEIGTISHSYKCSVCGRTLFHTTVGKNHVTEYYPYCHCGAKMKGAEDERG